MRWHRILFDAASKTPAARIRAGDISQGAVSDVAQTVSLRLSLEMGASTRTLLFRRKLTVCVTTIPVELYKEGLP